MYALVRSFIQPSATANLPEAFLLVVERQESIARVVALAAFGAGDKAAEVHSLAVIIFGNGNARAATARDQEHTKFLPGVRFALRCAALHSRNPKFSVAAGSCRACARLGRPGGR